MPTTSEYDIADAVLKVAAQSSNGIAPFKRLYEEVPKMVKLTEDDWQPSETRNGEPMWHQIVRNIQSHHEAEGNAVYEGWLTHVPRVGYKITDKGRQRISQTS